LAKLGSLREKSTLLGLPSLESPSPGMIDSPQPINSDFNDFFQVSFQVNGKAYTKAVDGLLSFEKDNLDDVTDGELSKALDQISYWRFTFSAAHAELERALSQLEREYRVWYAHCTKDVEKTIMGDRKVVKEDLGVPNNWFNSVNKQDIEDAIITSPIHGASYTAYQEKISDVKRDIRLLTSLRDVLDGRGSLLQTIARRRLQLKAGLTV